jgi:hypothetical protein
VTISPLLPNTFLLKRVYDYAVDHQPFRLLLVPHASSQDPRHAYFAGTKGEDAELIRTNLAEHESPVFDVVTLPANIVANEEEARKMILQAIDDDAWPAEGKRT